MSWLGDAQMALLLSDWVRKVKSSSHQKSPKQSNKAIKRLNQRYYKVDPFGCPMSLLGGAMPGWFY